MKNILIAHGEKILLLITVILCGFLLWSSISNPALVPVEGADQEGVERAEALVQQAEGKPAPLTTPLEPYVKSMRRRFDATVQAVPVYAFLQGHPDIRNEDPISKFLYLYEVFAPAVDIEDQVGAFKIKVHLPERREYSAPRASSAPTVQWQNEVSGATVTNHVRRVGVQIEMDNGDGQGWRPASRIGPNGVVTIDVVDPADAGDEKGQASSVTANLPAVEAMRKYTFRARVLVAATGHQKETGPGNDVIVTAGALPRPARTVDWDAFQVRGDQLAEANPPIEPVRNVDLRSREELYAGAWSEPEGIVAKSNVRFALERVTDRTIDFESGEKQLQANIVMRQLVKDQRGQPLGWTVPEDFWIPVGSVLGKPEDEGEGGIVTNVVGSDLDIRVDFTTALVLERVEKDVPRIFYYEVKLGRTDGTKRLVMEAEEKPVDVVYLRNKHTGAEFVLPELSNIRPGRGWMYPDYGDELVREDRMFEESDPSTFENPILTPAAPKEHAPDDPYILKFEPNVLNLETPYYSFPDGRIIWYDSLNDQVHVVHTGQDDDEKDDGEAGDEEQ